MKNAQTLILSENSIASEMYNKFEMLSVCVRDRLSVVGTDALATSVEAKAHRRNNELIASSIGNKVGAAKSSVGRMFGMIIRIIIYRASNKMVLFFLNHRRDVNTEESRIENFRIVSWSRCHFALTGHCD